MPSLPRAIPPSGSCYGRGCARRRSQGFRPLDAEDAHGGLLGAGRDLMGVQIVQAELIDQRLLDFFVQDEKAIGLNRAAVDS
jgi:hypothetical protein